MSARVAESAMRVPHSRVRELAEIAMSMDSAACSRDDRVLRLYFGESNLPTPDFIKRAAVEALADGYTFYTENTGLAQREFHRRDVERRAAPRAAPAPRRPLQHRLRRARSRRHFSHAAAGLH